MVHDSQMSDELEEELLKFYGNEPFIVEAMKIVVELQKSTLWERFKKFFQRK